MAGQARMQMSIHVKVVGLSLVQRGDVPTRIASRTGPELITSRNAAGTLRCQTGSGRREQLLSSLVYLIWQRFDTTWNFTSMPAIGSRIFTSTTRAFVELLDVAHSQGPFSSYDTCLISALAEGLGYGRDRAFFRAAGHYLLGMVAAVPEPLGRTPGPAERLRALRDLVERWRSAGAWHTLRQALNGDTGIHQTIQRLRASFAGLSTARIDILICNVVLPFAAAVASLEGDEALLERARLLYVRYPGLSSNQVTRAMSKQLQLQAKPRGACQQQGLHYIYQQTCREKRCTQCMARII
jgi:hypothetical protein